MPHKVKGEDGVKAPGRKKADARKRDFDLNGKYSAKSIRMRAGAMSNRTEGHSTSSNSKGKAKKR